MNAQYTSWAQVPKHLKTKTQLGNDGLKPGGEAVATIKTGYGEWDLYDRAVAVPKRAVSEAQRAALEKARETAYERRCCEECGQESLDIGKKRPKVLLCGWCKHERFLKNKKAEAIDWARGVLADPGAIILDTETTGLSTAQPVEIAIINVAGDKLLNTLVQPTIPVDPGARAVHGISDDELSTAPSFVDVYQKLSEIISQSSRIIIYNRDFDAEILENARLAHQLPDYPDKRMNCAMLKYAQYCGDWSNYYQSFRWQKLPCAEHRAMGDCGAVLELLKIMAKGDLT